MHCSGKKWGVLPARTSSGHPVLPKLRMPFEMIFLARLPHYTLEKILSTQELKGAIKATPPSLDHPFLGDLLNIIQRDPQSWVISLHRVQWPLHTLCTL